VLSFGVAEFCLVERMHAPSDKPDKPAVRQSAKPSRIMWVGGLINIIVSLIRKLTRHERHERAGLMPLRQIMQVPCERACDKKNSGTKIENARADVA